MNANPKQSSRGTRSWRVWVVLTAVVVSLAACRTTDLTSPNAELQIPKARKTGFICVRDNGPGVPADTTETDENGSCGYGYDVLPWW